MECKLFVAIVLFVVILRICGVGSHISMCVVALIRPTVMVAILVKNLIASNLPDSPSQVTGLIYAEIADEESKDPTYASVGVATGKYTYNITTNSSYDTVMLQNMNPNVCCGNI